MRPEEVCSCGGEDEYPPGYCAACGTEKPWHARRAKLAELGERTCRLASDIDFRNDVSLRAFALTFQGIARSLGLLDEAKT